ncbi:MAG TPA: hypothetical protein VL983_03385 [Terriglobales bacterium]|nr:hypothetical protein [Terriglobales bacterium]
MITRLRQMLARRQSARQTFRFDRPLILFQSDDWGRVGVRDREGWEELRAGGLNLGEKPYDYYSLETCDDLQALSALLKRHQDSAGRHPCLQMNFILANLDFQRAIREPGEQIPLRPLTDGLPEPWERPGLRDAYREGIRDGLFFPALHGLSHFCAAAVRRESQVEGERRQLLHKLWRAGTPYIYWRMPWIGYEYWDASQPGDRQFLPLTDQRVAIQRAAEIFQTLFGSTPLSACAPGYRANQDTKQAWFDVGVRVVQGGPGEQDAPRLDRNGMLLTFRNVEMEPATGACRLEEMVHQANACLARGVPAVISIHSINFHSTLRDFRMPTLALLDAFLSAMEKRWADLLYVHDSELWRVVTEGSLATENGDIKVAVTQGDT